MLKFFRKQGGTRKLDSTHLPVNRSDYEPTYETCTSQISTQQLSLEDEGLFDIDEFPPREQSRLSKTLGEVLLDKAALSYFVQFMEARNALGYVRCWLDIENFQTAIMHLDDYKKSPTDMTSYRSQSCSTKVEHDSLSVSTECDSLTADSTSLNDYSNITVSEKSACTNCCDKYVQEFTEDALGIFKKYIALEAPQFINCPDSIRNAIIENICNSSKLPSPECFKEVQQFVFNIMEKEYFEAFLQSDYFCKHQIDVLTSGNVVLDDILYNETALFYFMEYLEQENNRYLLEFWLTATNFQQQLRDQKEFLDPIEAQNDAVILYDKYFSLQALCPLGFGDKVRFAVEQNICGEHGLSEDCFNLPLRIIENVLDRHYLRSFLVSQLFYKYLSELINTVQSTGYCLYDKHKLQSLDCGSEKSFSTHSTFLAMEVSENVARKSKGHEKKADMIIDTRELSDPDALWRRKKHHRLSFGRVTELGKFVTDFEPEPDKKCDSKIKSVMKRFVNLEEDKKKEELAWQVAEMIVKSITSVTLTQTDERS